MLELANKVEFGYDNADEAFPPCDPGIMPFGSRVIVQIRTPKTQTKGGIILTSETRETDAWNTQIAKVICVGELAFKNRTTMDPWPEGSWCQPGDYVRVPKYGGDRWTAKSLDGEQEVLLVIFNDLDLIGKVTGDPLAIKAFI
jgi:co-chaperonin GroES (HSP10)